LPLFISKEGQNNGEIMKIKTKNILTAAALAAVAIIIYVFAVMKAISS